MNVPKGPSQPLPLPPGFTCDEYVESLLQFSTSCPLLQTLCGGVHILDFFTRTPDVYKSIFPVEWREWFQQTDIMNILDLLLREDVDQLLGHGASDKSSVDRSGATSSQAHSPPRDLLEYVRDVRRHCLARTFEPAASGPAKIARHVAVGMKVKKVHEVSHFAQYIDALVSTVESARGQKITHLVDFGAGQNYLGRTLSSEPYDRHVIAIEGRSHNIESARDKDVLANLSQKPVVYRNKKEFRIGPDVSRADFKKERVRTNNLDKVSLGGCVPCAQDRSNTPTFASDGLLDESNSPGDSQCTVQEQGNITYVGYKIQDGDLAPVLGRVFGSSGDVRPRPSLLTLSLHSCGNLLHHGLRTILNPEVSAVALVGCCYNLMTERLGQQSFKLPSLQNFYRSKHPRLEQTSSAEDPHGFPMSKRLCEYQTTDTHNRGVRFNITARSMAVQAPANWSRGDSEDFFTRHFYRALLQYIFVDRGVVPSASESINGTGGTAPVIIGTLGKSCYASFVTYVRGAVKKLSSPNTPSPGYAAIVAEKLNPHDLTDEAIEDYSARFAPRKHDLAVTWSMMAFSATVIESVIVVDRWLWLTEQEEVESAWVDAVFDYRESPRNLVVVGIRRDNVRLHVKEENDA